MSVLNENTIIGASGAGGDYEIEQSLRFNDDDGSYLSRTPSSASNRKTWTWSAWIKRGNLPASRIALFEAYSSSSEFTQFVFDSTYKLYLYTTSGGTDYSYETSALFRDPSAWYHIVVKCNTTLSTQADRFIVYVNGERQANANQYGALPQNYDLYINAAVSHKIGRVTDSNVYLDGYLGEINFIDGQALTPDSLGETGDYGEWKPTKYAGSYGTNGFYLPFKQDYTVEGFSTVTYEGNGTTQYIGGTGFSPSWSWFKRRSGADTSTVYDVVRGVTKALSPNNTDAESTIANTLTAFSADGFTLGSAGQVNANNQTYVAWSWDMGGTTASNTSGTINSSVRANQAYGQSIVTYTGSGSDATVGTGLSAVPNMVITKRRTSGSEWWIVWHSGFGDSDGDWIALNNNQAARINGEVMYDYSGFSSSTFGVRGGATGVNVNNATQVSYCFHDVSGYSKFSSYEGTGGTHAITLGFSPAFVMIKNVDAAGNWTMWDNTRNPNNPVTQMLRADTTGAEETKTDREPSFTATGFTIGDANADTNASGQTYIYMAFADTREYAYWLDQSGNNNDWTSEGGLTESDVMVDSPTNNFCTLNPLDNVNTTYSEGNLKIAQSSYNYNSRGSVSVSSGKWYWEIQMSSTHGEFGVCEAVKAPQTDPQGAFPFYFIYNNGSAGVIYNNATGQSTSTATMTNWAANDICLIAYDADNGKLYHGLNGVWQNSSNPASGSGAIITGIISRYSGDLVPFIGSGTSSARTWIANFGQDSSFAGNKTPQGKQDGNGIGDFYYQPPSGFLALCTKSLPSVDVIPSDNFNTVLYTGNGGNQSITTGLPTDFVWVKSRSTAAYYNTLFDTVRGPLKRIFSNTSAVEETTANTLTAFNSNGFTLGSQAGQNAANVTYASWNWKLGGATPSKTYTVTVVSDSGNKYRFDGFGTSAVTLNLQEGGTYTFNYPAAHPFRFSTTANGTHGGGSEYTTGVTHVSSTQTKIVVAASAPALYYYCSVHSGMGGAVNTNATYGSSNFNGSVVSTVSANVDAGISIATFTLPTTVTTIGHGLSKPPELIFQKGRVSGSAWWTFAKPVGNTKALRLDTTTNAVTSSNFWNNTDPTSSVVTIGANSGGNNSWLMYCFHSVDGYSKVGSYIGNGNANGPFVNCDLKPAFLLTKRTDATGGWAIYDAARDTYNALTHQLYPDGSYAEGNSANYSIDFVSNGFKIRTSNTSINVNNGTYIFLAFAENPFKNSNAR